MSLNVLSIIDWFLHRHTEAQLSAKTSQGDQDLLAVCAMSPQDAVTHMESTDKGLDPSVIEQRQSYYGANEIIVHQKLGVLREIFQRFANPLAIQLIVIALISFAMGDVRAATVVGVMVFLSVFMSYFQEARSSKAIEKLQAMVKTTCTVVRGGKELEIPMSELEIPGDVVILTAGSIIPADLRLDCGERFFREPIGAHRL